MKAAHVVLSNAALPALVLVLCVGAVPPVFAQQPAVSAADTVRASRARALQVLQAAAEALGGRDAVAGARGYEVRYRGTVRNGWQQARRWTDTTAVNPNAVRVVLDAAGRRALRESVSDAPGGIRFSFLTVFDTAGARQVDLLRWRTGTDVTRGTAAQSRASLAGLERLLPHTAVRQGLAADSLRSAGETERDGRRLRAVRWTDAAGRPATLWTDAATGIPAMVSGDGPGSTLEWSDYRTVDGLRVPHRQVVRAGGQVITDSRVERVDVRPALADSVFALPAGYADPPAPGDPRATRLAEGVYRLDGMPGGYHAAFVVQDDGVTVLEAPTSPQYTQAALRLIGETAPGKPVRRVLVTHHHSDHVAGLGPYVAAGATLVVGAGMEEAVRRQLPDSLRAAARFQGVAERASFGTGAVRVDVYAVPNTHADGNLAFYLPAARVLFQGDLFYVPERGPVPPAFPVTEALAKVIRERGLAVETVVGVHGRTGTMAEVRESLRLAGARR
ncbi:MAG TPA: MBL fold metallo-hydrolase [Longimicrobiaceae bacterium]|nr:MBL fold metallo-hydrolase [Longimicrobiaceae bacterium]